jgi:formyl-CoA transferase
MNAAIAILMALLERGRSGKGQFVEATLYDSGVALQHPHMANFFLSGKPPARSGNAHTNIYPYDCFPTKTKQIFVAIGNDRQFQRLCDEIGVPELPADPRFRGNSDRNRNRVALRLILEKALATLDGEALSTKLLEQGVPCGPVMTVPDLVVHPHTLHREMVVEKDGYKGTGTPVKLGRTPGRVRSLPPQFGEATREVLAKAGYSHAEIDGLLAGGIAFDGMKKAAE